MILQASSLFLPAVYQTNLCMGFFGSQDMRTGPEIQTVLYLTGVTWCSMFFLKVWKMFSGD